MTARDLKHPNPDAWSPFDHNRIVQRRKKYWRIAHQLRTSSQGATRSFRNLAAAADRAADSLRGLNRVLVGVKGPEMVSFRGGERIVR